MKSKRTIDRILHQWKIHPFLISIYPLLALVSWNFTHVAWNDVIRPLGFIILYVLISLLLLSRLHVSFSRASLAISLSSTLFFSYLHPINWIFPLLQMDVFFILVSILTALWVAVWIIGVWLILRSKKQFENITYLLNIISVALVAFALFQLSWGVVRSKMVRLEALKSPLIIPDLELSNRRPDIYYLVLDSYTRDDLILDLFDYDNSQFSARLESMGFFVARNSYSNYGMTIFSISSALNSSYLNPVPISAHEKQLNYGVYRNLITKNHAMRFLKQQGYEIITIESGYPHSELTKSDLYIHYKPHISGVESTLLENSFAFLFMQEWNLAVKRERLIKSFQSIQEISNNPSPKFVFLHVMALHSPYLFDRNGAPVNAGLTNEEKYREQLIYVDQLLEETVSTILSNSENEPIIILQGDHGPGGYDIHNDLGIECVEERFKIFNAIYFPPDQRELLYEEITPVNIFRLIFNTYFGTDFDLLPNESYYSMYEPPVYFADPNRQPSVCGEAVR